MTKRFGRTLSDIIGEAFEDAPKMAMLWLRGPGPRAEKLFKRIEKLAK